VVVVSLFLGRDATTNTKQKKIKKVTAMRGARAIRQCGGVQRRYGLQQRNEEKRLGGKKVGGWRKIWCGMEGGALCRKSCRRAGFGTGGLGVLQSMGSSPAHHLGGQGSLTYPLGLQCKLAPSQCRGKERGPDTCACRCPG
jgi:hypothetical protein